MTDSLIPQPVRDAIEAELDLLLDAPVWVDAVCAVIEAHLELLAGGGAFRWRTEPKDATDG